MLGLQKSSEAVDLRVTDTPMGPGDLYKAVQMVVPHMADVDVKEEVYKYLSSSTVTVSCARHAFSNKHRL